MSTHVQSLPHNIQAPSSSDKPGSNQASYQPIKPSHIHTPNSSQQLKHETPKVVIDFEIAFKTMNVAGMTRIESFTTYWKPKGGQFGDWALIYPILKERQKLQANWESWILDKQQPKFRRLEKEEKEEKDAIKMMDNDDSVFWYFWDYDTGTKKRMNGIAARQIEAGYQHIKQNDWEVDPVLRSGVEATEGIYEQLRTTHKTFYRLSYSVQPAAQKDKKHICVYQINVSTGFQRLLERFPPETTAAKIRPGSFMEVYVLNEQETEKAILVDFWVKGGRTHFQQTWDPSVVRFVIDSTLADNRQEIKKNIMKLYQEKKLVSVGQHANVELKQEARQVRHFLLSLPNRERLAVSRDWTSSKLAIMNYMHELRMQKSVSTEVALSATKEYFGQHFFTVFPTEQRFRKEFLQQHNEKFVVSYDYVPFDLDDIVARVDLLFDRFDIRGPDANEYCLSYLFDPKNKRKPISFAPVYCGSQQDSVEEEFPLGGFIQIADDINAEFGARVKKHRTSVANRHPTYNQLKDISDVLVEDAVFDVAIKATRELEDYVVVSAFPFDREHVYVFRSGSFVRLNRKDYLKFLMKMAHLQPKEMNNFQVLSVETYADGVVQYGCRQRGAKTKQLSRKRYHQIKPKQRLTDGDEKELEPFSIMPVGLEREQAPSSHGGLENATSELNALLAAMESAKEEIERSAKAVAAFYAMGEIARRTEGDLLCEFLSYAVDDKNDAFPTLAVFKDMEGFSARNEIRCLYSSNEYGEVKMAEVIAASLRCWNNQSVLGLVNEGGRAHLFEIDVEADSDGVGSVTESLNQLNLHPRAVLAKSNGKLSLSSEYIQGAGTGDGLQYSLKETNLGEILKVKFGECGMLRDFLQSEHLDRIEGIIDELHEWSRASKRVGRPGDFAVYFAQSCTFDHLRDRLKRTKKGAKNDDYDEYMEHLDRFSINKWKQFTNKSHRDHKKTIYVMVIDHAIYTLVKLRPNEDKIKQAIEREYRIDSINARNSFVYRDNDVMNVREECTRRGFYVSLGMEPMEDFECHICFETKNSLSTLSCGHSACHQCIRQQLLRDNNNCALCRHDIMHPYMIPRPDQNTKNLIHKYYGPMFLRHLQYRSFEDDVEWNTIQAEGRGAAAVSS